MNPQFKYSINDNILSQVSEMAGSLALLALLRRKHPTDLTLERTCRIRKVQGLLQLSGYDSDFAVSDELENAAYNMQEAFKELKELDLSDTASLLKLHKCLMKDIDPEAGSYRTRSAAVYSGTRRARVLPAAGMIDAAMKDLLNFSRMENIHMINRAAVFCVRFESIRPFANGCGRTLRLWLAHMLAEIDPVFEYLPYEIVMAQTEDGWERAVRDSLHYDDCAYFTQFLLENINAALKKFTAQFDPGTMDGPEIPEPVMKLLDAMDEQAYSTKEMMEMVGLKHRQTFRDNYLLPAMEAGLITMTVPDKPNSRNQKYRKL